MLGILQMVGLVLARLTNWLEIIRMLLMGLKILCGYGKLRLVLGSCSFFSNVIIIVFRCGIPLLSVV